MSTYKYHGNKKVIQLKGDIAQELGRIEGYPYQWTEILLEKIVRKLGKKTHGLVEETVRGFKMDFILEKNGIASRYAITSQNGFDTITNIYLIYKNIKQRVVDVRNGVISVESGFNDLKLLTIEVASDPYKILGVTLTTPNEEIKRIYREMVKLYHPDKAGKEFEGFFQTLQQSWERIKAERHIE
jgi:hypothetical protein